jgi:hypothetical protein
MTPYLFALDARIDNELRPRISLGRSIMIFLNFQCLDIMNILDLGLVNDLPVAKSIHQTPFGAGAEYMLSRNVSLMGSYDNRFGAGGGLSVRF